MPLNFTVAGTPPMVTVGCARVNTSGVLEICAPSFGGG
jgi:hypothetical protein